MKFKNRSNFQAPKSFYPPLPPPLPPPLSLPPPPPPPSPPPSLPPPPLLPPPPSPPPPPYVRGDNALQGIAKTLSHMRQSWFEPGAQARKVFSFAMANG